MLCSVRIQRMAIVTLGVLAIGATARGADEVTLQARFPEGQTLRYRVRTSMNQQTKGLGMEMPSNLDRTEVRTDSIGKPRGDAPCRSP